jgi:N-acetylglucosamine-6-phosphate deacetylase
VADRYTIAAGRVLGPHGWTVADLAIEAGRVADIGSLDAVGEVIDAAGLLVAPGFVDLQLNGAHGLDLTTDPATLWEVAAHLPRYGVTAFLPTVITAPLATYDRAIEVLRQGPPAGWLGARPLGWHFEGPMLNPSRRGAHPPHLLQGVSRDVYGGWSRRNGVRLVTLAPELAGGPEAVRALRAMGVVVSAGHTNATTAEVAEAVDAGVAYLTHLFNAMAPLAHREPGPIGTALAGGDLVCGLIADGVHVHPLAVAAAWRALGPERLNLVTDAVSVLGMPDGRYRLGALEVSVGADGVHTDSGTLAGSNLSLDQAVRNLLAFTGCTAAEAIATVTSTPSRLLGRPDQGRLQPGADADLVLLTPDLHVVTTIVGGVVAHPVANERRGLTG